MQRLVVWNVARPLQRSAHTETKIWKQGFIDCLNLTHSSYSPASMLITLVLRTTRASPSQKRSSASSRVTFWRSRPQKHSTEKQTKTFHAGQWNRSKAVYMHHGTEYIRWKRMPTGTLQQEQNKSYRYSLPLQPLLQENSCAGEGRFGCASQSRLLAALCDWCCRCQFVKLNLSFTSTTAAHRLRRVERPPQSARRRTNWCTPHTSR